MKPIKIYLRQCFYSPNTSLENRKRPDWFDKRRVLKNLIEITDWSLCDISVIYDSHFGELETGVYPEEWKIHKINCGTEASSFLKTLEIIETDGDQGDKIIYILEDDYLHREGWDRALIEAFNQTPAHYISLYDHLDKYTSYPGLVSVIFVSDNSHWRTTPSTCNTYACRISTLKEDMHVHKHYSVQNYNGVSQDHSKFMHLGNIGRVLLTPIPGYSTHCNDQMSPVIKWEKYQ